MTLDSKLEEREALEIIRSKETIYPTLRNSVIRAYKCYKKAVASRRAPAFIHWLTSVKALL